MAKALQAEEERRKSLAAEPKPKAKRRRKATTGSAQGTEPYPIGWPKGGHVLGAELDVNREAIEQSCCADKLSTSKSRNLKIKRPVIISGKTYISIGGRGTRNAWADVMVPVVPIDEWTGPKSEMSTVNPETGYEGMIVSFMGVRYVLGGPEFELRVHHDLDSYRRATGQIHMYDVYLPEEGDNDRDWLGSFEAPSLAIAIEEAPGEFASDLVGKPRLEVIPADAYLGPRDAAGSRKKVPVAECIQCGTRWAKADGLGCPKCFHAPEEAATNDITEGADHDRAAESAGRIEGDIPLARGVDGDVPGVRQDAGRAPGDPGHGQDEGGGDRRGDPGTEAAGGAEAETAGRGLRADPDAPGEEAGPERLTSFEVVEQAEQEWPGFATIEARDIKEAIEKVQGQWPGLTARPWQADVAPPTVEEILAGSFPEPEPAHEPEWRRRSICTFADFSVPEVRAMERHVGYGVNLGEAWDLLEAGELAGGPVSIELARKVHTLIVRVRFEMGDPVPMMAPMEDVEETAHFGLAPPEPKKARKPPERTFQARYPDRQGGWVNLGQIKGKNVDEARWRLLGAYGGSEVVVGVEVVPIDTDRIDLVPVVKQKRAEPKPKKVTNRPSWDVKLIGPTGSSRFMCRIRDDITADGAQEIAADLYGPEARGKWFAHAAMPGNDALIEKAGGMPPFHEGVTSICYVVYPEEFELATA